MNLARIHSKRDGVIYHYDVKPIAQYWRRRRSSTQVFGNTPAPIMLVGTIMVSSTDYGNNQE